MATKEAFYEIFAKLHCTRIESFFDRIMSKNDFISNLLCVFSDGFSLQDTAIHSAEACQRLNRYLECDLYSAELFDIEYIDGGFRYTFEVQIKTEGTGDVESEFTFFISTLSGDFKIEHENCYFEIAEDMFWSLVIESANGESTLGTLKRS